jgi:predicted acetyltransferase
VEQLLYTGEAKMGLYLRKLSKDDGKEIYEMLQGINHNDDGFRNEVYGLSLKKYKLWLKKNEGLSKGIGLEKWMVPQTVYWLYFNNNSVGYGRIRHYMNENLKNNSGHIGYAIAKLHRGLGYGDKLLKSLLQECFQLGIKTVQVGVDISNVRSNKLIQKNGGVLYKVTNTKNIYKVQKI